MQSCGPPGIEFETNALDFPTSAILHRFSHAKQQYLMYLHYCKDRFRIGAGVEVNKTQSNR